MRGGVLVPFAASTRDGANLEFSLPTVAILLVLTLLYRFHRKIRFLPLDPSLPGPPSHPLLGIVPYVLERWSDWPVETLRLSRKYGWRTWGGPAPNFGGSPGAWIFLPDEVGLRHILSDNFGNFAKNIGGVGFGHVYAELLGNGIFAADGEQWVMHRKVASNMFSRNLLRHTARVTANKLEEIAELFRDALSGGPAEGAAGPSAVEFDLQDLFFRMTFDTTSLVVFGCEFDSIRKKKQHPFPVAFDEMQLLISKRLTDPFFTMKRLLRLGFRERRIRKLKTILDEHAAEFISSKRRSAANGCELGPDLLSRFLYHSEKTGDSMSNQDLRDVVMNMLLAGRDTTACALSWAFWELTKRPDVVDNILEEVVEVCGTSIAGKSGGNSNFDYSYDAISRLRYTHAVVMEVLRLHPSVSNDHKFAIKDDVLPDGTKIPAGAGVAYMPFVMGRSEKIWGNNASEFRPERFLEKKVGNKGKEDGKAAGWELKKEPSQFKYPVFNAGPRLCLGKQLALTTMKLTLAYLLPRFEFADRRRHDGSYRWTFVRSMKNGFRVDVSRGSSAC